MTPAGAERPVPGVGAAVVDAGRVLLVKRGREPAKGQWAVPGGKVDLGETVVEAVRWEVAEETGLVIEVKDVIWAGESIGPGDPPEWHYVLVDFVAIPVSGEAVAGDDAAELGWFNAPEALDLPLTPTMPDLIQRLVDRRLISSE